MNTKNQILAFTALSIIPIAATAQISIGNFLESHDSDTGTAANTLASFEVAAGSNRTLVVAIASEDVDTISSLTFGLQSFTKAVSTDNTRISEIWYLDNPDVGTADVTATFTGAARSRMGVVSLTGVAPGGPTASDFILNTSTTPSSLSFDLTTVEANTFVIGAYTQNNGGNNPINPGSMTDLMQGDSGSSNSAAGFQIQSIAGLSSYTWTLPDGFTIPTNGDGIPLNGLTIASFSPVPEPSTYALIFGGMAVLLLIRRRMR